MAKTVRKKTSVLLQMEAVECGAAALGIILRYHGLWIPLAELRRECGVSRDGSKASSIVKAARRYGLRAKGYSKDIEGLREQSLPFIVFWKFNHFLVVEGWDTREVFLNDPAFGHRRVGWAEFEEGFTGVVLAFEPDGHFQPGGERPRILPAILKRLRGQYGAVVYCVLAGLALVLPGLAIPSFSAVFIDNILLEKRTEWARPLILAMAMAALMQLILKLLQLTHLRRLRVALSARLSSQFLWHLLRLPISYYAQRFPGEVANRSAKNERVAQALSGQLATACIEACTMIFYAVVMAFYDLLLTGMGVGLAAVNFVALRWFARNHAEAHIRLTQESGRAAGVAMATLQNLESIKASGVEPERFGLWAGYFARSSNAESELARDSLALGVLPSLFAALTTVAILVLGGFRVIAGEISIGELVAFQQLMGIFLAPVNTLVGLGATFQEMQGDLQMLDDVLENPMVTNVGFETSAAKFDSDHVRLEGSINVEGLSYGYNPLDPPLIANFNLSLEPGKRVAFVGGSGSGKSTLSKVIAGIYPAWEGRILLDGRPRDEIPRPVLSNSIGMVDQDVMLFEGTVRDNLTLWDRTIPEVNIVRACQDAAIHDIIVALPNGYSTILPEGGTVLSGGQRQRLEIARALVNNPALLIFDEATSALDSETERIINENIRRRGCTCIIVAHRLSTIRDCDEIIVLENGTVVERGRHEDLWAAGGPYARLLSHEGTRDFGANSNMETGTHFR